jgi:hypothetical protein
MPETGCVPSVIYMTDTGSLISSDSGPSGGQRGAGPDRFRLPWESPVKWAQMLREQASVLRSLAGTFADDVICQDLIRLAERCEELAAKAGSGTREAPSNPIDDPTLEDE